jgi:hypothetical protein
MTTGADCAACWVEDELHAVDGGHERHAAVVERGMFPGTLAP